MASGSDGDDYLVRLFFSPFWLTLTCRPLRYVIYPTFDRPVHPPTAPHSPPIPSDNAASTWEYDESSARGLSLSVDETAKTVELGVEYFPVGRNWSESQGSVQVGLFLVQRRTKDDILT